MNNKAPRFPVMETLWRFFASIRLTVVLLLTLALTSIVGTLIPQNAGPAAYIQKYGMEVFRIFSILGLFDMYHAGWFRFLLAMLTLNVLVCSMDRFRPTLRIVLVAAPDFNIARFRRVPEKEFLKRSWSTDEAVSRYTAMLFKTFSYVRTEKTDQGKCIFAEKGRWTRLGFYVVHVSVVLLLLGGLIGSLYGFEGFVEIPEGESVSSVRVGNTGKSQQLDFDIRCDDFSVTFYDTGQPKEYRSSLTILEQSRPVRQKDIIVNDPLRYKGINIFQSSYGSLAPDGVSLQVKSQKTGLQYPLTVDMGQTVALPEEGGGFTLVDFKNAHTFKGVNLGQTFVGRLLPKDGPAVEVMMPTRFPGFDKMRGGRFMITIDKFENRFYTGLQVTKDPGVWMVYVGFIMMITGCFMTFFMSHQRLCVEVPDEGDAWVAGTANKNRLGMQNRVKKIAGQLGGLDK